MDEHLPIGLGYLNLLELDDPFNVLKLSPTTPREGRKRKRRRKVKPWCPKRKMTSRKEKNNHGALLGRCLGRESTTMILLSFNVGISKHSYSYVFHAIFCIFVEHFVGAISHQRWPQNFANLLSRNGTVMARPRRKTPAMHPIQSHKWPTPLLLHPGALLLNPHLGLPGGFLLPTVPHCIAGNSSQFSSVLGLDIDKVCNSRSQFLFIMYGYWLVDACGQRLIYIFAHRAAYSWSR